MNFILFRENHKIISKSIYKLCWGSITLLFEGTKYTRYMMQMIPMAGVGLVLLCLSFIPQYAVGISYTKLIQTYGENENLWYKLLSTGTKTIPNLGRGGIDLDLPPNFFDQTCKDVGKGELCEPAQTRTDLCFIVQLSCSKDKKDTLLKKIHQDINKIIAGVGKQSLYTIVTYSKSAKQFVPWTDTTKTLSKKFKGGKKCDDCEARLPLALDMCKKQWKALNGDDPTREVVPDVLVTYTDGISFSNKYDLGYQNDTVMKNILNVRKCENTAGRPFKIPDYNEDLRQSDEWETLNFTNINEVDGLPQGKIVIKELTSTSPQAMTVPSVEGLVKEKDEIIKCQSCCNADIVLIIDRSNSIRPDNIKLALKFYREFIARQERILNPGLSRNEPGLRFAILSYNCKVTVHCYLGEKDYNGTVRCVEDIPATTDAYTNTVGALKEAKNQFDRFGRNNDSEVRQIVILATDGRTWNCYKRDVADPAATIAAAKTLKDEGKEIYVLGLPNHQNRTDGYEREWRHIASESTPCHIIDFTDGGGTFENLGIAGAHLTKEICAQGADHECPFEVEEDNDMNP
ncbi:unnamed protein product [Owenia fusiformis]|uniref:VWFA domain-containing protein n=1 Tax=Owenia fusiformis TaxID=6347 RepID=A0A8S4NMT6_OWEFU|nr:unnamed protein product [Owenia fusiformis]